MLKTQTVTSLWHHKNRYLNERAIIIGGGPTTFDYRNTHTLGSPVFFINDVVFIEQNNTHNSDWYFHSHHAESERYLDINFQYIFARHYLHKTKLHEYLWSSPQINKPLPKGSYVPVTLSIDDHWPTVRGRIFDESRSDPLPFWAKDKDYVGEYSILSAHTGSITSLIHFIWYCGFTQVLGIGINPVFRSLRHDPRIGYCDYCPNLPEIAWNQGKYFEYFGIRVAYYD